MYCKVDECRYASFHVTKGHQCGKCKKFGHGEIECKSRFRIDLLKQHYCDSLPINKYCTVANCKYKSLHITSGHKFYVTYNKIKCPICNKINTIKSNHKKIFGLEEKCKICMINNIEAYLPQCGHTVMCFICMNKIKNT